MGKQLGSALDLPQIATPATPAASRNMLYVKSDSKVYVKDSGGTESLVGPVPASAPALAIKDEGSTVTGTPTGLNFVGDGVAVAGTPEPTVTIPGVPTGTIMMYAGTSAPSGWLICDGSSIANSGATAALYTLIGTRFGGAGLLPDLRDRYPIGTSATKALGSKAPASTAQSVTLTTSTLPPHTHTTPAHNHPYDVSTSTTGGSSNASLQRGTATISGTITGGYNPSTSGQGNTGDGGFGGTPIDITAPYVSINFIIKL